MLVSSIRPDIELARCAPGQTSVNAIGHMNTDIKAVFPYLNAVLPGAQYRASTHTLRFRLEGFTITLYPRQIATGGFTTADEAVNMLTRVQTLINDTWAQRAEIEPLSLERRRLDPMTIYRLLPRTNCGVCGQPTCLAFAAQLLAGKIGVEICPALADPQRTQLQALVDQAPAW